MPTPAPPTPLPPIPPTTYADPSPSPAETPEPRLTEQRLPTYTPHAARRAREREANHTAVGVADQPVGRRPPSPPRVVRRRTKVSTTRLSVAEMAQLVRAVLTKLADDLAGPVATIRVSDLADRLASEPDLLSDETARQFEEMRDRRTTCTHVVEVGPANKKTG